MASPVCLQDWTTIQGGAGVIVLQSQERYAELIAYQDVCLYVEIASILGSFTVLTLETSPTNDPPFFLPLRDVTFGTASYFTIGMQSLKVYRFSDALRPLTRLLRWSITGSDPWSITFRVWLSLNQAQSEAS